MEHTPVPWDIQNKLDLDGSNARLEVVKGINKDGSKDLPTIVRMLNLSEQSYTNARFIVQACNAHEELLSLLQRAVPYMKTVSRNDTGGYSDNDPTLYEEIRDTVARLQVTL